LSVNGAEKILQSLSKQIYLMITEALFLGVNFYLLNKFGKEKSRKLSETLPKFSLISVKGYEVLPEYNSNSIECLLNNLAAQKLLMKIIRDNTPTKLTGDPLEEILEDEKKGIYYTINKYTSFSADIIGKKEEGLTSNEIHLRNDLIKGWISEKGEKAWLTTLSKLKEVR
jgi:hypothetical protein